MRDAAAKGERVFCLMSVRKASGSHASPFEKRQNPDEPAGDIQLLALLDPLREVGIPVCRQRIVDLHCVRTPEKEPDAGYGFRPMFPDARENYDKLCGD